MAILKSFTVEFTANMFIKSLRVLNYKGYRDAGPIALGPRFNIVVGQNNSGKTALLETLSFGTFANKPHRSLKFPPNHPLNPRSEVELEIQIDGVEIRDALMRRGGQLNLPVPRIHMTTQKEVNRYVNQFFTTPNIKFNIFFAQGPSWLSRHRPSHHLHSDDDPFFATLAVSEDKQRISVINSGGGTDDHLPDLIGSHVSQSTYVFRAERLNIGTSTISPGTDLVPNASNLPSVMLVLQSNAARFDRLNAHLRNVFPSIHRVSVVPSPQGASIKVWNVDPATERDDLAIDLNESGTGVGQVLAILYVVLTAKSGLTIVIDEPNSFLHPGAIRKLIQILKTYDQHQYIVATHAPEVISAAEPDSLHLIRWNGSESTFQPVDQNETRDLRGALTEVGARLSDVFGADAILWVEGPTEAECFPRLLQRTPGGMPLGLSVIPLRNTGDLDGRRPNAKAIWDIYQRLSTSSALVPRTVAFSLDRERRTQADIDELRKRSKELVHFLPRRTYENYLIHPAAIAHVLNSLPTFTETPVSVEVVDRWLRAEGGRRDYWDRSQWCGDIHDEVWLQLVAAPQLLANLFINLSGAREEYRKTLHSIALTEWLLENDVNHLHEVITYVTDLVTPVE